MQTFRDELAPYLGTQAQRKKVLREVIDVERQELGLPPLPRPGPADVAAQQAHMARISRPKILPEKKHMGYLRAPSSLRGRSLRAKDDLFAPSAGSSSFWLYGAQKVTQSTLMHLANQAVVTPEDLNRSPVCHAVRRKIDHLVQQAMRMERCGILFDIISTSKIIDSGLPHKVGSHIYEYIESKHGAVTSLKFVFVGITDNVNCCAARDVFCRDEMLSGKYVGQTKRTFEALDNVHMFPVMPSIDTSEMRSFLASEDGSGVVNKSSFRRSSSSVGSGTRRSSSNLKGVRAATPATRTRAVLAAGDRENSSGSFFVTQQESQALPRPASVL